MGNPATRPAALGLESRTEEPDLMTRLDTAAVMGMLAAGIPLSLLIDLSVPTASQEILAVEGGDAHWLRAHVA